MWEYLNKAIELGSVAAINTMGNCYMNGINKKGIIDEDKAMEYYLKASEYGYVYSYNNIGLIYESHNNLDKAYEYFKLSAYMKESWALNKIGEIYRKNNNLEDAYFYYKEASKFPLTEINYYSYYNLDKYYYMVGNKVLGIEKDLDKSKKYLKIAYDNGIKESNEMINKINHMY